MGKEQTTMMSVVDKWNRMPIHIFDQWMKENYERLMIQEREQIQSAHLAGQNDDDESEIEYYDSLYEDLP